jgi:predicted TIM-barrel fold metal-dependent hydrolase
VNPEPEGNRAGEDMDRLLLVSADGHWGGPPSMYRDYIEREFWDDLDALTPQDDAWRSHSLTQRRFSEETLELIDRDHAVRSGGELGAWQLERRLLEMDRQGVAAEVLLPGHQETVLPFFNHTSSPSSPRHRAAGARAYHRQLADVLAGSGGRLVGVAEPGPCLDMDATVEELRWVAAHGFVAVAPPRNIGDPTLPPLYDQVYEPFWQACADTGLSLNVHAGYGFAQGLADGMSMMAPMVDAGATEDLLSMSTLSNEELSTLSIDQFPRDHAFRVALTEPRRVLWQLMLAGVFDRYPTLQLVFTEIRADWVPATLEVLDRHFADGHASLARPPRDYWERNVWMAPSSTRKVEVGLRHEIGLRRFMFGTDYPHPEGTWPNTHEWIRDAFAGVPVAEARLILGDNAAECFDLDRDRLVKIAAGIGPAPDEVLGEHIVDERLLAQFHARAGYQRPPENVQADNYLEMLAEDEAGLRARAG